MKRFINRLGFCSELTLVHKNKNVCKSNAVLSLVCIVQALALSGIAGGPTFVGTMTHKIGTRPSSAQ